MFATLLPGDVVLVERWPIWTGFQRGDIVVFHDPLKDDRPRSRRPLVVKRLIGLPGDTVLLREGKLFVNGERLGPYTDETHRYLVRLARDDLADSVCFTVGLPAGSGILEGGAVELPLNDSLAELVRRSNGVRSVEPLSRRGAPGRYLFPYSPNFRWSMSDYGPFHVPKAGDTVRLDLYTLPLFDRLVTRYEGHTLHVDDERVLVDGRPTGRYVVGSDHYFVLGDARDNSSDSRSWGCVPADHLVGRVGPVLLSWDDDRHSIRREGGPRWVDR